MKVETLVSRGPMCQSPASTVVGPMVNLDHLHGQPGSYPMDQSPGSLSLYCFFGCSDKWRPAGCLKQWKWVLLLIWKPEVWNHKGGQGYAPSEDSRGGQYLASSKSWCLQVFLACGHITPVSAHIFTWAAPLCVSPLCISDKDTCLWI